MKLEETASGLIRPECVLSVASGDIYVAHFGVGIMRIATDGTQEIFADCNGSAIATNGFALHPDGSFLIADLGDRGGVWKLSRDGELEPFVTSIMGQPLPQTNFVSIDAQHRVWITISTRQSPREKAFRQDVADGYIIRANLDGSGAQIVADGLGYTNEAHVDPSGKWLYVNETFARRLSRFPIEANGLGTRETAFQFFGADFPDGLAFDEAGGIWVTCIGANRVWRIDKGEEATVVITNRDDAHYDAAAKAFEAGNMRPHHLKDLPKSVLGNVTSICFGGEDRRWGYLGNLANDHILRFRSQWTGVAPPHWQWT